MMLSSLVEWSVPNTSKVCTVVAAGGGWGTPGTPGVGGSEETPGTPLTPGMGDVGISECISGVVEVGESTLATCVAV